ncbi:glycosyltransferase family 39 protein [Roseovarius sp. EGI FJ00037]|uniref:glycosyltransferase family 39 protein n=1 Tax=Roseovarius salincola TaxID=2978479 RepID=UPI0022A82DB1|nr:glycosyltransferase family 39 protein [Roseovarius sp. EGI FJ00037]MCZ0814021.1 glycosyltransferase family 39 protein [Roseovarius sp. EGI FJ00037]
MIRPKSINTTDFILLFLLLVILFPVTNILYSTDSMGYVLKAQKIAERFAYGDPTRGPMMPAVGALFISLFGKSVTVLSVSVRVFYVLSVIGFAGLAWRMYGRSAGWLAILYFAFAPMLTWPATKYHVDIFLLGFVVFALWSLYETLQSGSRRMAVASGVLIGLAFLMKETAIMLLPLWAMAWMFFPHVSRRKHLLAILAAAAGFALIVLPWAVYVQMAAHDASNLLGNNIKNSGTFDKFIAILTKDPAGAVPFIASKLLNFVNVYFLSANPPQESGVFQMGYYGWFLLAGIVATCVRAIRKSPADRLIVMALFFHLPFAIFLGWKTYDARQALIIVMLASLTVGALSLEVTRLFEAFRQADNRSRFLPVAVALGLGVLAAFTSLFSGAMLNQFRGERQAFALFQGLDDAFQPIGALTLPTVQAAAWLERNTDSGAVVYSAHARDMKYFSFVRDNARHRSPIRKHNVKSWLKRGKAYKAQPQQDPVSENRLIYIDANRSPNGLAKCIDPDRDVFGARFCKIYYLREDDLMKDMIKSGADWLVVSSAFAHMAAYFDAHPAFERAQVFGEDPYLGMRQILVLYRVDQTQLGPSGPTPLADVSIAKALDVFEQTRPEAYPAWREEILFGKMGLNPSALAKIRARDVPCFVRGNQSETEIFWPCH